MIFGSPCLNARAAQSKIKRIKNYRTTDRRHECTSVRRSRSTKLGADEKYAHIKVFST